MKPGGEPGSSGTRRAAPVRQDLILPVLTQRNCKSLRRYKANPAAAFGPLTASPLSAHRPYRGTKRATRRSRQSKEQARATPYKARSRRPGPAPAPPPSFGPAFSRSRGWAALLPQRTSLRPLPSDDLSTKASGAPVKPGSHTRVTITEGLRWRSWRAPPSRASPPPTYAELDGTDTSLLRGRCRSLSEVCLRTSIPQHVVDPPVGAAAAGTSGSSLDSFSKGSLKISWNPWRHGLSSVDSLPLDELPSTVQLLPPPTPAPAPARAAEPQGEAQPRCKSSESHSASSDTIEL